MPRRLVLPSLVTFLAVVGCGTGKPDQPSAPTPTAPTATVDPKREAMRAMEGTYALTQMVRNGQPEPADMLKLVQGVVVADGTLTIRLPNKDDATAFTIDPAQTPPHIDLAAPGMAGTTRPGIYRLDADGLTVVWSLTADRPADFDAKEKTAVKLVLARQPRVTK